MSHKYIFKYIIIGDMSVGKSCLMQRFIEQKYSKDIPHTIGVEFGTTIIDLGINNNGTTNNNSDAKNSNSNNENNNNNAAAAAAGSEKVKLQIWDTAGQERFKSVTKTYYRGSCVALLIYDISNRNSFSHVSSWLADARAHTNSNIILLLVGNKSDLVDEREVSYEEGETYAKENNLFAFLETSALNGENVDEIFRMTAFKVYENIRNNVINVADADCGVQLHAAAIPFNQNNANNNNNNANNNNMAGNAKGNAVNFSEGSGGTNNDTSSSCAC